MQPQVLFCSEVLTHPHIGLSSLLDAHMHSPQAQRANELSENADSDCASLVQAEAEQHMLCKASSQFLVDPVIRNSCTSLKTHSMTSAHRACRCVAELEETHRLN